MDSVNTVLYLIVGDVMPPHIDGTNPIIGGNTAHTVYKSTDGGSTWNDIHVGSELPEWFHVSSIAVDPDGRLYVEGISGLYIYSADVPTGIGDVMGQASVPMEYELLPNYPNPFNPVTTLRYQLPKTTNLRLAIYNVLGQHIRTLVDATQDAGHYAVQWDGRNLHGDSVSSGVYLYHLESQVHAMTRKMLLLR